jgi:hypothetical protein
VMLACDFCCFGSGAITNSARQLLRAGGIGSQATETPRPGDFRGIQPCVCPQVGARSSLTSGDKNDAALSPTDVVVHAD